MPSRLAYVTISGFRSISDLRLDLITPVTLLIGANGAGKSNIVDAFELLGFTVDRALQEYVLLNGGFSNITHASKRSSLQTPVLEAWGAWTEGDRKGYRNGYKMTLSQGRDDRAILQESTYTHNAEYAKPYDNDLGYSTESQLKEIASRHLANQYLLDILSGCRVFHFDDTGLTAPSLRRADIADSETLHSDASNVAAVLFDMKLNRRDLYDRVVRTIQNVAPFFEDFVLREEAGSTILRWKEFGLDSVFSGNALSSGTLRFICLTVLIQQPRSPSTIVLDEPELGLHPSAIFQLADVFRSIGDDQRIVAATQSVTLLSQFGVADVAIVERQQGSTVVSRPDRSELDAWLTDYSVGELWEMNLLGGRPQATSPRFVDAARD
ncbi:AAA family ATPase [Rathayibacter rathayi]|nr:AAA family ATPase [Rathayibacter rathayi]TWD69873.1 putative ATPase [Rathayibacter rathayi]SOE02978.1 Predicted ATPase [Rathayibacter rathayi] [Rathayibacter rathayi NCPPB 2980 = VKM Ac-1601]